MDQASRNNWLEKFNWPLNSRWECSDLTQWLFVHQTAPVVNEAWATLSFWYGTGTDTELRLHSNLPLRQDFANQSNPFTLQRNLISVRSFFRWVLEPRAVKWELGFGLFGTFPIDESTVISGREKGWGGGMGMPGSLPAFGCLICLDVDHSSQTGDSLPRKFRNYL